MINKMNEKLNEYTFEEIKIGLKETFQVHITESMENNFAKITGNYNPLASDQEYASTTKAKRKGTKQGKQFVKQPKSIAKKTKRFRT